MVAQSLTLARFCSSLCGRKRRDSTDGRVTGVRVSIGINEIAADLDRVVVILIFNGAEHLLLFYN